jgi:hypothetical protein
MIVNYTEGYSDAQQSWTKSDYHGFESIWDLSIGKGSSFSGSYTFGSTTQTWSGEYNDKMMKSFKYTLYRKWNSGSSMIREEWMTVELRNLPVEPDFTSEYGIRFGLDGWDCDNQKPNPDFEKSIVKIETKFKFYHGQKHFYCHLDFSKSKSMPATTGKTSGPEHICLWGYRIISRGGWETGTRITNPSEHGVVSESQIYFGLLHA